MIVNTIRSENISFEVNCFRKQTLPIKETTLGRRQEVKNEMTMNQYKKKLFALFTYTSGKSDLKLRLLHCIKLPVGFTTKFYMRREI